MPSHLFGGSTPQERDARKAQQEAWRRRNAGAIQRATKTTSEKPKGEQEQDR
jgi:hypothetical protein